MDYESDEDEGVLSEVHIGPKPPTIADGHYYVSRFWFSMPAKLNEASDHGIVEQSYPPQTDITIDDDGDIEVPRRQKYYNNQRDVITIVHSLDTPLQYVGLQVWRGALIMAEYILHNAEIFKDSIILEVGSGTGFVGIVAARFAQKVFITDYDQVVLRNCVRNVSINLGGTSRDTVACVRRFDWFEPDSECCLLTGDANMFPGDFATEFAWTKEDLEHLQALDFVIAADVIYDESATDALIHKMARLLKPKQKRPILLLSVEKRINFTLEELKATAPAYDYFRKKLEIHDPNYGCTFRAEQVNIDFPTYFEYDRTHDLELWKIWVE